MNQLDCRRRIAELRLAQMQRLEKIGRVEGALEEEEAEIAYLEALDNLMNLDPQPVEDYR